MAEYRAPKGTITQRFRRVANIVGISENDDHQKTIHIPGLAFTDFTRAGVISSSSIAKLLEMSRLMAIKTTGSFLFLPPPGEIFDDDTQFVVLCQSITVTPLFHQRARLRFPMVLHIRLIHVGSSSYSIQLELIDKELKDVLIESTRTFALMDKKTGRSKPLPGYMRKQMLANIPDEKNRKMNILRQFPMKPLKCFEQPAHVRHSDTDFLYHANQSMYFNYCIDAATEATRLGFFRQLKGDLLSYTVEKLECVYKGEAIPGNVVTVCVWQSDKNPGQLYGQIEKSNEIIWIGTISFRLPVHNLGESRL